MPEYQKIISLVPSLTELIIDLGLKAELVGRTRFCINPKDVVGEISIIGGTKNPRLDTIEDLQPDLIIANKEENRPDDVKQMMDICEVLVTDIATVEDAFLTIRKLGNKLGVSDKAERLITTTKIRLDERPDQPSLRTAYMIWKEPWMSVGRDTYIHDVMKHYGLNNVFKDEQRYPSFDLDELKKKEPELILLSSEPYPFKERHTPPVEKACPNAKVMLVEGQWFSWYGSHMKHAFERLNGWRRAIV